MKKTRNPAGQGEETATFKQVVAVAEELLEHAKGEGHGLGDIGDAGAALAGEVLAVRCAERGLDFEHELRREIGVMIVHARRRWRIQGGQPVAGHA